MNGVSRKTGRSIITFWIPQPDIPARQISTESRFFPRNLSMATVTVAICLSLGLKEGLKFINQQDGIEAIFITSDYKLHYSDGLKDLN